LKIVSLTTLLTTIAHHWHKVIHLLQAFSKLRFFDSCATNVTTFQPTNIALSLCDGWTACLDTRARTPFNYIITQMHATNISITKQTNDETVSLDITNLSEPRLQRLTTTGNRNNENYNITDYLLQPSINSVSRLLVFLCTERRCSLLSRPSQLFSFFGTFCFYIYRSLFTNVWYSNTYKYSEIQQTTAYHCV